jgi:hypothetical protein
MYVIGTLKPNNVEIKNVFASIISVLLCAKLRATLRLSWDIACLL